MTVNYPHRMYRTGTRRYEKRPPASCRSARWAWDWFAEKEKVVWLQLLEGYWGAMRESGSIDEIENLGPPDTRRELDTHE